jgi:hypothetical protein
MITNRTDKTDSSLTNTQPLSSKPIETNRYPSFQQVLANGEDQVTVRELLIRHVPVDIQIKITQLFNKEYIRRQVVRDDFTGF